MPSKTKAKAKAHKEVAIKTPMWKVCPHCKKRKRTKSGYYPDAQNKTGYRTYCKDCLKRPAKTKAS